MRGKRGLKPTIFHKKNRKGQFYLLAAIIIITVMVGFITVSNYSYKKTSVNLYDLGEELGIESQNVIDYGTAQEKDIDTLLTQFVEDYVSYAGNNKNLYFIFGTGSDLQAKAYHDLEVQDYPFTTNAEKISITIDEVTYQFDLLTGETFYFVISQEIEGETYIVTG